MALPYKQQCLKEISWCGWWEEGKGQRQAELLLAEAPGRPSGPAYDRARISFAIQHPLHPLMLFGKSHKMQGMCQLMN